MKIRKYDLIVAGLVLLFAFLLSAPYAFSAPLTPQQAADVYAVAYGQCPMLKGRKDGCPVEWLEKRPNVHVVSGNDMCDLASMKAPCTVRGMFDEGEVYVSADADFSTAYGASILLHEYMHYFQWLDRKLDKIENCAQWLTLEYEAYEIQAHVLEQARDSLSAYTVRFTARLLRCSE